MKKLLIISIVLLSFSASAQIPDHIYHANIRSVKLHRMGDIYGYPVINQGGGELLELHFDDLDADLKNYYYSFQLCNADWTPANLQSYDYIRGFQSNRISTYRNSSLAQTRYMHYQVNLPENSMVPTRSGNYLLKVFLNDDTSQLVFTRRFMVVNTKTTVAAQVLQPYNFHFSRTHQRIQVSVSTAGNQITTFSPQDLKVVIVQNFAWPSAMLNDRPSIFRGNYYEYSDEENTTFPAGKEWRWIDLRSLRLMSDRMRKIADSNKRTQVYVKPDGERAGQIYVYYSDIDGMYTIENQDGYNPNWQSDYADVHFTYVPPGNRAYEGKSVYLYGELTSYTPDLNSRMDFNDEKGVYEKTLFLKQGYYNYSYITVSDKKKDAEPISFENTEGNYWGTQNHYMVMVYFRPFGARADELIGFAKLSSLFQR